MEKMMSEITTEHIRSTEEELRRMQELIDELRQDNSNDWKRSVLYRYTDCIPILEIIYNPYKKLDLTGRAVLERLYSDSYSSEATHHYPSSLKGLLDRLVEDKSIRGNLALDICGLFIDANPSYQDMLIEIFDCDLNSGISVKTINKVYPNLIPTYSVPLAKDYNEKHCDFRNDVWFASRKLDGIRCEAWIYENEVKFFSRNGKEMFTLDKVKQDILENYTGMSGAILDGEICIVDEEGNENFQAILSEYRRHNHTITNPKLVAFDMYTMEEFQAGISSGTDFITTLIYMNTHLSECSHVSVLEQKVIMSDNKEAVFTSVPSSWEGLMLRKNAPTIFDRSKNLLKVKEWIEEEYVVVGIQASMKTIDGEEQLCCGALVIEHKGYPVEVGTGISDSQRVLFYRDKESIVGKTITVKYFEETVDKNGHISLRFTSLKAVWERDKE